LTGGNHHSIGPVTLVTGHQYGNDGQTHPALSSPAGSNSAALYWTRYNACKQPATIKMPIAGQLKSSFRNIRAKKTHLPEISPC